MRYDRSTMPATLEHPRQQEHQQREPEPFDSDKLLENITKAKQEWAQKQMPMALQEAKVREAIRRHDRILLEAEPGSGKSTIAPALFLEELINDNPDAKVVVTQPRRLATSSLAGYVGEQIGPEFVDYRFRGHRADKPNHRLEFTVEQSLLNDIVADPSLKQYDAVILDEVHERSITMDILIPLLKRAQEKRKAAGLKPLKVVLASGTLDVGTMKDYFEGAHHLSVEGRAHPVTEHFSEKEIAQEDLPKEAAKKIVELLQEGKVPLAFMPGRGEIDDTEKELQKHLQQDGLDVEVVTIVGGEESNPYEKINSPVTKPRVYIATNAAETSITIPGITAVIDSGLMRKMIYDPETRLTTLETMPHTKANWKQRSRRAGRVQPGEAHALFTKAQYDARDEHTVAEFLHTDLSPQILRMKEAGIDDVHHFDYIEHPGEQVINQAIESLQKLGALDKDGKITEIGKKMAEFDEDPHIARMLVEAKQRGCVDAVATLVGFVKARGSVFDLHRSDIFNTKFRDYIDPDSDFITALNVWNSYIDTLTPPREGEDESIEEKQRKLTQKGIRMSTLNAVSKEKRNTVQGSFYTGTDASRQNKKVDLSPQMKHAINMCGAAGFADRILRKDPNGLYTLHQNARGSIGIDRSSVFANKHPDRLLSGKIFSQKRDIHANKESFASMNIVVPEELTEEFAYLKDFEEKKPAEPEPKKEEPIPQEHHTPHVNEHDVAHQAHAINHAIEHNQHGTEQQSRSFLTRVEGFVKGVEKLLDNFSQNLKNIIKKIGKFLGLSK
jgi:HrpA-like RNA helicase